MIWSFGGRKVPASQACDLEPMQTPMNVSFVQSEGAEIGRLLALYERAIPANERRSSDAIVKLAGSRSHRISVLQQGGDLLGFSILFLGLRVRLLEYLAVDERCRGEGLGACLYKNARRHSGNLPMLVEVESSRGAGAALELRRRRLAFYDRLGCRRIEGLHYILPLSVEGTPPSLDLLVDEFEDATISRATVRNWLEDVYVGAYDCAADAPRLDRTFGDFAAEFNLVSAAS